MSITIQLVFEGIRHNACTFGISRRTGSDTDQFPDVLTMKLEL